MSAGSYIGRSPQYGFFEKQVITTANGVLVSFPLNFTTADSAQLLVSVGGVIQQPGASYTVDASVPQNIVFTEVPANGIEIWIIWLGKQTTGPTFSSGMITGKTALGTAPAAGDTFIIYDDDAGVLKKVAYSNVHSGVADMAGNSVKVRDNAASGAPTDKVVATTEILIGDGTGFTAAALSGDVSMSNTGAVTIANNAVENAMMADNAIDTAEIADNAVGLAEMAGLARASIIVGDASGDPSALVKGTSEQVLRVNTAGTDLEYADAVGGAAWALKTGAYTAVAGDGVMVDTSSSAITITLPISSGPPSLGDFVRVLDATGNAATNNITVARNGNNIQGAAADLTIATARAAIGLVYVNVAQGWVLIEN